MAWIIPTVETLKTQITGGELEAFQEVALAVGQSDPVPQTIADTVGEVRGYVAGCSKNKLGPAGTIPDQLVSAFIAIVRFRLITRFPEAGLGSDGRTKEYDTAIVTLRDTAACRFAIELPEETGPELMPSGAGTKLVKRTQLRFSRRKTDLL